MMRQLFRLAALLSMIFGGQAKPPNIVFIMTDDQDLHLGSVDYQSVLKSELMEKGTSFTNHWATVALCCPSRASLLRGQAAHNTNITNVGPPGGNYDKWLVSGENNDYLPHWLVEAGYNAEYIGKFMNGQNIANYNITTGGWSHADCLLEPYTYLYNNVVMSANGERPWAYHGYHQTDVIRAKALDRLRILTSQDKPFFLAITPTSPHVETSPEHFPVPLARHANDFANVTAPQGGNFNPDDAIQQQKVSWVKDLPLMNSSMIAYINKHFRRRIQCLQGIDEIIHDVVELLENTTAIDNTYIIYTTDNGYHIGNHRVAAGKSLPYREDTNLPLIVRGPGVPANRTSNVPSAHLDFAPTFLEIAGLATNNSKYPLFLDGRSLLSTWNTPAAETSDTCPIADAHEILNVEFWGNGNIEQPWYGKPDPRNSYKTLRIAGTGEGRSYLYSRWCTNESELYDTSADPYEQHNLALNPDAETNRTIHRLNALLLATKSCADITCRNPWRLLQPHSPGKIVTGSTANLTINCLEQAMDAQYDTFFAGIPNVAFQECKLYQDRANEAPFWPADAKLGSQWRLKTDNYVTAKVNAAGVKGNAANAGSVEQRHVDIATIMKNATRLTDAQLGLT